jgi:hypothetical protein
MFHSVETSVNKMPHTSTTSSSCCSASSEHVPHRYINLEFCMNALQQWEDIANAIWLTNNERSAFIQILFLNHLFQTICQIKCQLEQEKQCAWDRISRLLLRKSFNRLYAWIINMNLDIPSRLPIRSPHTPPKTRTPTPDTHSSHSAEPKPVHIRQHTKSEID